MVEIAIQGRGRRIRDAVGSGGVYVELLTRKLWRFGFTYSDVVLGLDDLFQKPIDDGGADGVKRRFLETI